MHMHAGIVVDEEGERCGVEIAGVGGRSIRRQNLKVRTHAHYRMRTGLSRIALHRITPHRAALRQSVLRIKELKGGRIYWMSSHSHTHM